MSDQAFPVSEFPEPVREFVSAASESIGCDAAFVAVPTLVTAAAAIGGSSVLQLKSGWREPSMLWAAIVAKSGTGKSPAMEAAVAPLMQRHISAATDYQAMREVAPDAIKRRYVTADVTLEGLAMLLGENPQGMLLARDELSGWIGAFDKYHNGKGDAAGWLSLHSGSATIVDRKKSESLCVPRPRLSIIGTIQPAVLEKVISYHLANGLAARLLLCQPRIVERRWTEAELNEHISGAWAGIVDRLLTLHSDEPDIYRLGDSAMSRFSAWFDQHNGESAVLPDSMRSLWSKLEASCARICLVLHLLDWASGDQEHANEYCFENVVQRAITIVEYFKVESREIYSSWDASPLARDRDEAVRRVQATGGSCSERDYARRHSMVTTEATAALQMLVNEELGEWQPIPPGPQGGRPTRRFILH